VALYWSAKVDIREKLISSSNLEANDEVDDGNDDKGIASSNESA